MTCILNRPERYHLHLYTTSPGLSTISDLSWIDAQPPPSFLCCPRPSSRRPSSLTSVTLVPTLHLLPPSTPFRSYGTHPFYPHAHTISILTDLLYSLTPFLFQLSYAPLSPVPYCSGHFSALPTLYTPDSFCIPHPFHILHKLTLATPGAGCTKVLAVALANGDRIHHDGCLG